MPQINGFKILGVRQSSNKLLALKALKDTFGLPLHVAVDIIRTPNFQFKANSIFSSARLRLDMHMIEKLSEHMNLEVDWEKDIDINEYSERTLTPAEDAAMEWYKNQDPLTQVMVDNYIKAIGYGPPACGS